jgi:hypothetical protein
MPAKRTRIARELRRPKFSAEILRLFIYLESLTDQDSKEFNDGSRQLAEWLGLGSEFLCSCCCVNYRTLHHGFPNDDYPAAQDFWRVKRVRQQLLEAAQVYSATVNGRSVTERDPGSSKVAHEPSIDIPIAIAAASRRDEYE